MNLIALAFRNLLRQKRRTLFLSSAVAIGFAVIVLLLSLSGGLSANIKDNLSHAFGGHVFVTAEEWNAFGKVVTKVSRSADLDQALKAVESSVVSYSRRSAVTSTLVFGTKSAREGLAGVQWDREVDFRRSLTAVEGTIPDTLADNALLLNAETAKKLGVRAGDEILVKFANLDGQQNVLDFTVAAVIVSAGGGFFSQSSYLSLSQANRMLGLDEAGFQTLNLFLKDSNQQVSVAQALEKALAPLALVKARKAQVADENPMRAMLDRLLGGDSATVRWEGPRYNVSLLDDFMSTFASLVTGIQGISLVIFVILMQVTVIGISNTFRMILQERTVEIGTMRALGLRRSGIRKIFLWEAAAVLVVGLVIGSLLATLLGAGISLMGFPTDSVFAMFTSQGHLSMSPGWGELAAAVVLVLISGVLAASGPARKASRLFPADALRHRA